MIQSTGRYILVLALIAIGVAWSGNMLSVESISLVTTAEAVVGRPATPVSYAGVARRTTVNRRGNRGGPVNRVGRR
jgi:hypothetical protein